MVMKLNNEVEIDGEDDEEKMPSLEDVDDVCVKYPVDREKFMVRRALNIHMKLDAFKG
jgi:hypothetical protein